jgi:hypothetical protein
MRIGLCRQSWLVELTGELGQLPPDLAPWRWLFHWEKGSSKLNHSTWPDDLIVARNGPYVHEMRGYQPWSWTSHEHVRETLNFSGQLGDYFVR